MKVSPFIVGIGGTLRAGSATERAVQVCLAEAQRAGARTVLLNGPDITVPPYDPSKKMRTPEARRLVDLLRACDGLIVASPAYHGSISGLVKNALDYAEDLRGDEKSYLDGRAVGCVACGAGWQSIGTTLASLRAVVHALRGWPTPFGAGINTAIDVFDTNGGCRDGSIERQLKLVGYQVVQFARAFRDCSEAFDYGRLERMRVGGT